MPIPQEQPPAGGFTFPFSQTGHQNGQVSILSDFLQLRLLSPQMEQQITLNP